MEHNAFLFVNTALVMGCTAMAIVFLTLPLPYNQGLRSYRVSLRFLAGAYLSMAILKILMMVFDVAIVDMVSIIDLIIGSLQALLFTFTLIALFNPLLMTKHFVFRHLLPILVFTAIFIFVGFKCGNPQLSDFDALSREALHPAVILRELLLVYYLFLLIYLTFLFRKEAQIYEKELDNYFSDSFFLRLSWVRYCFYAALTVGIGALFSCFFFSVLWTWLFTIAYTIFYMFFGFYYIQYPRYFTYIQPVIYTPSNILDDVPKGHRRYVWEELRLQILEGKYYLHNGVNIEEMAHFLKIGRTSLSNFVNNDEGMSFNSWINFLRVEEAKILLLKNPDYNLAQIAEMVGYSESSNFSRQFKLFTRESPSVWRQQHKL